MIDGKKTYIIAGMLIVLGVLKTFNWIDTAIFNGVFVILTGGGIATLRIGVAKNKPVN